MGSLPHGLSVPAEPNPASCLERITKTNCQTSRLSWIVEIRNTI